jgi:hypothetical protein
MQPDSSETSVRYQSLNILFIKEGDHISLDESVGENVQLLVPADNPVFEDKLFCGGTLSSM